MKNISLSPAAVVIGALRFNLTNRCLLESNKCFSALVNSRLNYSEIAKVVQKNNNKYNKSVEFANSVDPDEAAHYEPPHLQLQCLSFRL